MKTECLRVNFVVPKELFENLHVDTSSMSFETV